MLSSDSGIARPRTPSFREQFALGVKVAADPEQVRQFLLRMKMALARGRFLLAERDKNLRDLAELGMVPADVTQVLQRLSLSDYCDGPLEDDKRRAKQWWVFGPQYEGVLLYIKVCVNREGYVECLSFHRAAYPLAYPLRGREDRP